MPTKSLAAELFRPSTSVAGGEAPTVIRGQNILLRGPQGNQYFEVHPGDKDLNENYNLFTMAVTGTIAYTSGSNAVTGSGTSFKSELHIGQQILTTTGEIFAVKEVLTDTSFTAYNLATTTSSGKTAYRLPQLFEIDRKRGVLLTGNALEFRLGHKVAVGSGVLYINGSALSSSLTAKKTPQAAIYRPAQNDYVIRDMGFAGVPPQPVITIVTGGTKGLIVGNKYSFMISYWAGTPEGTDGFSNPCQVIKKDGASADIAITATTDRFEFDFTTSLVGMPTHAKGFIVWGSQAGKTVKAIESVGGNITTTSPNETLFQNGPWYKVAKVLVASQTFAVGDVNTGSDTVTLTNHPFSTGDQVFLSSSTTALSITGIGTPVTSTTPAFIIKIDANTVKFATTKANALAGTAADITGAGAGTHTVGYLTSTDKYYIEYLDEEVGEQVTGDNYPPTDCEFLVKVENRPTLVSCYGKRTSTSPAGSNPGPLVSMSKFSNPDGFPPEWTAGGQHNIIGAFEGVGRVFLMTPASLDFIVPTGLLGQAASGTLDAELPLIWRPYWKSGAANRYSIIIDDDTLYGRSGGKFIRSIGNGDENVRKYDFGAVVEDVTRDWVDGLTFVVRNPKEGQICFVRSAAYKNSYGYWVSEIWPFSVWADAWLPKIVLSQATQDQIICGVATVDEQFEYLMGGRDESFAPGDFAMKTYQFGAGQGYGNVPWYIAWQPSDDGVENRSKRIRSITAVGRLTSPVVQIHGAVPGGSISLANLENGNGSETGAYYSGDIALSTTMDITRYLQNNLRVSNLSEYAVRIGGTWDASNTKRDRLEELLINVETHGRIR